MDAEPVQQAAPQQQQGAANRVPKRRRAHRQSQRRRPQDEGPTLGDDFRYSEAERTTMVQAVLKELTTAETVYVRVTGDFPKRAHTRLAKAYKAAHAEITHWRRVSMLAVAAHEAHVAAQGVELSGDEDSDESSAATDTDDEDAPDSASEHSAALSDVQGVSLASVWCGAVMKQLTGTEDRDLPELPPERQVTHDNIKKQAKFWTKRFLRKGNVHDVPPSVKGTKRQRCLPIFAEIRAKVLQGWKDKHDRWHAYFSLDDLERRDRRRFAEDREQPEAEQELKGQRPYHELKADLDIKHNRYVWSNLKALYPHMRRVKHSIRRVRKSTTAVMVRISQSHDAGCVQHSMPALSAMPSRTGISHAKL